MARGSVTMVTVTTRQSWFSRLGRSVAGIVGGVLLFLAGLGLLWWNEGRAVRTARGLEEGAAAVVSLAEPRVDPASDGRLVHLSGMASTTGVLRDDVFDVEAEAIALRRTVEMYQWREESRSETRNRVGGGTETVTTYTYDRVWSERAIDSSAFQEPASHQNPAAMPFPSRTVRADAVRVGEFALSGSLAAEFSRFESLPPPAVVPEGYQVSAGRLIRSASPASPEIGDLRVAFEVARPAEVSIVARQDGPALGPYRTATGTTIEMLRYGRVPAAEMFAEAVAANTLLTWILRLVGLVLLFAAVTAVLAPLGVLADVIPLAGRIVRFGTALVALAVAIPAGLITIALAWLFYRPLIGIALLVVAVGVPVFLLRRRRSSGPAVPPPIPPIPPVPSVPPIPRA